MENETPDKEENLIIIKKQEKTNKGVINYTFTFSQPTEEGLKNLARTIDKIF